MVKYVIFIFLIKYLYFIHPFILLHKYVNEYYLLNINSILCIIKL